VYIETFGCQMNELDSELVTGALRSLGYRFTPEASEAGVVLYNTCSVREHAEQKVWSRLGELAVRKREEPGLVVGVLGCMAEREGPGLMKRMPVVDVMVGPAELDKLPALLDNAVRTRASLLQGLGVGPDGRPAALRSAGELALQGAASRRSSTLAAAADQLEMLDLSRAISPDDHAGSAYVRITRGCNKFCSYCVVPHTRGAEVHRPPDHIVEEVKRLADAGVVEVTLLGQTVNHYRFEHGASVSVGGVVQPQKGRVYKKTELHTDAYAGERVTTFADLLARVHDEVPSVRRLRFVTSYPRSFGNDVLWVMRESPRICRYLHVPAQSGSDRMLALMNRGYSVGEYFEFLDRARSFLHQPELGRPLTVAGDIIVGFPTETDADHEATKALLVRARYKNCFIFKYSSRPGTTAHDKLVDDVPEEVKRARNAELLALQNQISGEVGAEYLGRTVEAFVQGVSRREAKRAVRERAKVPLGGGGSGGGTVALTISAGAGAGAGEGVGVGGQDACELVGDADRVADLDLAGVAGVAGERRSGRGGGTVQMSARTDGDLIVFFDVPEAQGAGLVGAIVKVRVETTTALALHGATVAV
jgi:tRNA-2-methylthio-N6-dimethylallyladenosine synthase